MEKELRKYLETFMIQSNWLDENVPEQARAIFTTLCFIGNIDADASICENLLLYLYNISILEDLDVTYDEFEEFMISLII